MTILSLNSTLINLLRDKGVNQVVVIDDAYDPPWPINRGTLIEFWSEIEADENIRRLFCEITQIEPNDLEAINEYVVLKLWEHREFLEEPLKQLCDRVLFVSVLEKRAQLSAFTNHLREANIELISIGQDGLIPDNLRPHIIFIDYFMGADHDPYAVTRAKSIASNIYEKYDGTHKPLIVLMSSVPGMHQSRESFREESGLLGGMFYFVPKDDLTNREKFFLQLGAWVKNLPTGYMIQEFVSALESSFDTVKTVFLKDIRSLSITDYAYIQNLSLQKDGHPLGEYMRWLYGAHLLNILFTQQTIVREQQAKMNKFKVQSPPLSQSMPSLQLAEIYKSALFEYADDVAGHPATALDQDGNELLPYLHLGDLFINQNKNYVWMIINAECDLAMSADGQRSIPDKQSIFLIPGVLQPLAAPTTEIGSVRTELFEYDGRRYRILWNTKNVLAPSYGEFRGWMTNSGCKRIARLQQSYALEVQRAFSSDLTRIGMPVAPPFYRSVRVQLLYRDINNHIQTLSDPLDELSFLVVTKERKNNVDVPIEKCVFTIDLGFRLQVEIDKKIGELLEMGATDNFTGKPRSEAEKASSQFSQLKLFREHFDTWFLGLNLVKFPDLREDGVSPTDVRTLEGEIVIAQNKIPIRFRRNFNLQQPPSTAGIFLINIIEDAGQQAMASVESTDLAGRILVQSNGVVSPITAAEEATTHE